jgi:hypothetical protein
MSCTYCHASVVVPEELRQVSGAATWSTRVYDSFIANTNDWLVGDQDGGGYFTAINRSIADGRYHWEAQGSTSTSITTAWLRGYSVSDFHLLVSSKHIYGSRAGSSCGVIFRIQDNNNYYWFGITDHQFFSVSLVQDSQWLDIVDWTKTDAIKPNGVNQLEVIAYATHFTFLINGRVVSEVDHDHFPEGLTGLAIQAYTPGEEITFDFLDIILRAP